MGTRSFISGMGLLLLGAAAFVAAAPVGAEDTVQCTTTQGTGARCGRG